VKSELQVAVGNFVGNGSYPFAGRFACEGSYKDAEEHLNTLSFLRTLAAFLKHDHTQEHIDMLEGRQERHREPEVYMMVQELAHSLNEVTHAGEAGHAALGSDEHLRAMANVMKGRTVLDLAHEQLWERSLSSDETFLPERAFERLRPLLKRDHYLWQERERVNAAGKAEIAGDDVAAIISIVNHNEDTHYDKAWLDSLTGSSKKTFNTLGLKVGRALMKHDTHEALKDLEAFKECYSREVMAFVSRPLQGGQGQSKGRG